MTLQPGLSYVEVFYCTECWYDGVSYELQVKDVIIPRSLYLDFATVTNYQVASFDVLSTSATEVRLTAQTPVTFDVADFVTTNNTCTVTPLKITCSDITPLLTNPLCDVVPSQTYDISTILATCRINGDIQF